MTKYTNPVFNASGNIDMEINHPVYGPIPFTASPDDTEEHGRLLFADAQASAAPYVAPLPTLAQRKKEVDALRVQVIASGLPYDFSDGPGTIQLRNESDVRNVMGVAASGQSLASMGSSETISFRDAENVTHDLSPNDAILMGLAVSAFISAHYSTAWSHKDAMQTLSGQALADYDITTGWSN